jgi:formylglycine-generating enzyme
MRLLALLALMFATRIVAAEPVLHVPVGRYYPFFKPADSSVASNRAVVVDEFWLDAAPATRADYLDFVRAHPEWRRSHVRALFAENNYLADWHDDLDPGTAARDQPVTFVSWFAARAYCSAHDQRLLTVAEWERVAGSGPRQDSSSAVRTANAASPFGFAMGRMAADIANPSLRVGKVWEWNADFNSAPFATSGSLFCGDGYRSTNPLDYAAFLRYSFRSSLRANYALKNLGFRCGRTRP